MSDATRYPVPANFTDATINAEKYAAMYRRSIADPDAFWGDLASEFLSWDKPWDTVSNCDLASGHAE